MTSQEERFDLLCLGRLGVDLYSEQEGTPLSSVQTFIKYVGGSAANVCVGVARLGLSTAICSRVGDEGFGEFVLDALVREGVNTALVQRDPVHPTGVVALALYKREHFPRIFFYTTSADLAFEQSNIDWGVVHRADAVLLTGSYLLNESLRSSSRTVANSVRDHGGRVVLDVDYRPVLWGLVPVGQGNDMETGSLSVTEIYQQFLPLCDLIVGTEEEIAVAGGSNDVTTALGNIRRLTDAAIVLKRGAYGASVYDGPIPPNLEDGVGAKGYTVDVLNNTGAGDAFLSGFLSRWLRNHSFRECVQSGNASGAIVVTRNGCAPAMPFAGEHARFMEQANIRRPDDDDLINRIHRMGSRRPTVKWTYLVNLEDHRLRSLIERAGGSPDRTNALRQLYCDAIFQISDKNSVGFVLDSPIDSKILEEAMARKIFVTRSLELDHEQRESSDLDVLSIELRSWHSDIVPRIVAGISTALSGKKTERQLNRLARVARICQKMDREIAIDVRPLEATEVKATGIEQFVSDSYEFGLEPDYWMLPDLRDREGRSRIAELIRKNDISCRGFFILPRSGVVSTLDKASRYFHEPECRGIIELGDYNPSVLKDWLGGSRSDTDFVAAASTSLQERIRAWKDGDVS